MFSVIFIPLSIVVVVVVGVVLISSHIPVSVVMEIGVLLGRPSIIFMFEYNNSGKPTIF